MTYLTDEIEDLIASGPDAIEDAPPGVILECARRYIRNEIALRTRSKARASERNAARERIDERMLARMTEAARDYSDQVVTWTRDLLEKSFIVDGVPVLWGDATPEQHARRARELERHAAGTVQTAALHRNAERAIRESGAANLRGVTS